MISKKRARNYILIQLMLLQLSYSDSSINCDLKYGKPTRSTKECICYKECVGNGCQRSQGFIWYNYETCTSCRCIGKDENVEVMEDLPRRQGQQRQSEAEESEGDPEWSLLEYLEDNWRLIFAIIVSMLFILLLRFVFMQSSKIVDS